MFEKQVIAFNEIMECFSTTFYVMLFAMMQSGKTDTFKLVGCEMLRRKMVKHVVIFTGNSECQLKQQTMDHTEFINHYVSYLSRTFDYAEADARMIAKGCLYDFEIIKGTDLPKFKPQPNTLYIHDESHFGQSIGQQVDKFLTKIGVNACGEVPEGNFYLSVSATPFSEQVNNIALTQKKIVRLHTTDEYTSPETLKDSGRLIKLEDEDDIPEIVSTYPGGYVLCRATDSIQTKLKSKLSCKMITFDQKNKSDINDILKDSPSELTVIFIKEKCRMGKKIDKRHIVCGIETSSSSKTDTTLQGLLGRFCGYNGDEFNAPIYISNLDWSEIDLYIELFNGDEYSIPQSAMNIKPCKNTRSVTIPCRFRITQADADYEIADALRESIMNGTFENPNPYDIRQRMTPIILELCHARRVKSAKSKQFTLHRGGAHLQNRQNFNDAFASIQRAFELKQANTYGPGYGAPSKEEDQLIVWNPVHNSSGYVYVYMFIENENYVPTTTGKEIFKDTDEYFDS